MALLYSLFRTVVRENRGETMVLSAVGLGNLGGEVLILSVDLFGAPSHLLLQS